MSTEETMSAEERVNAMRGYKSYALFLYTLSTQTDIIPYSTLSNPRTSNEAKKHAQEMLNELGGDQPREELHVHAEHGKDPTRVVSGLKA